jgi:type I restriction enzyme, S subunit
VTAPVRLKHVARIAVSNVDKKSIDGEAPVRLCNYTDVYYNERVTERLEFMNATASPDQLRDLRLRPGDVLITKDSETADDIAVPALVESAPDDLVCGYHLALIRPDPELVEPRFLFWSLAASTAREWFSTQATGVTRFGLRSQSIADAPLSLPSILEQREIADFLDAETARIDALIEKKHRVLQLMSVRRSSAIGEALESAECEYLPLRRVVAAFVDYRGATPEKSPSGVPLVTATNVSDGEIDFSLGQQFVGEETYIEWMRRGFPEVGDVLLTTEAPLGEVAMIDDTRVALAQRIILMKPDGRRVLSEFLYASLRSPVVQADLLSRASGSTVWGIRADRLRDVRVHNISLPEQYRVVALMRKIESEYRRARELLDRQIALLREHRQALNTAAVTGQLDLAKAAA